MFLCYFFYAGDTFIQFSDSCGVVLNVFSILICFVFDTFELTTIHCIGRSLFHFTSSHTTNFAALINGNPIVDCYSATISHADRR